MHSMQQRAKLPPRSSGWGDLWKERQRDPRRCLWKPPTALTLFPSPLAAPHPPAWRSQLCSDPRASSKGLPEANVRHMQRWSRQGLAPQEQS